MGRFWGRGGVRCSNEKYTFIYNYFNFYRCMQTITFWQQSWKQQRVALLPHRNKVHASSSGWARMPFCVEFACFLRVLWFPPQDMPYRWIGQRKLAIVSECVCEWVSVLALGLQELHSQGWVAAGRASGVKTCAKSVVRITLLWWPLIKGASRRKRESWICQVVLTKCQYVMSWECWFYLCIKIIVILILFIYYISNF